MPTNFPFAPEVGQTYARLIRPLAVDTETPLPFGSFVRVARRLPGVLDCRMADGTDIGLRFDADDADALLYTVVRTTNANAPYALIEERLGGWGIIYSSLRPAASLNALRTLDDWYDPAMTTPATPPPPRPCCNSPSATF